MERAGAVSLAFALAVSAGAAGLAAEPFRVSGREMPKIVFVEAMRPFVMRAAQDVAGDMEKIFGVRPEIAVGAPPEKNAIVLSKAGTGWENYAVESRQGNVLMITGSDDRGVMFGLYRFASFPGAQIPMTAAGSNFWIGNVCRMRIGPRADKKKPWEIHRLFTRFSKWNKDPAAFGKLVFREW